MPPLAEAAAAHPGVNGEEGVAVNALAVADTAGSALLSDYGEGFESWSTLAPRSVDLEQGRLVARHEIEVHTTTLDDYCAEHEIERIDVLKVDVEGAELRVLDGARGLLDRRAIDFAVVEVADTTLQAAGASALEVVERLEAVGLRPHVVDERGVPRPFRVFGAQLELANVVAASAAARRRLT